MTKPGRGKEGDLTQDFTLRLRQSRLEAGQSQRNPMTIHCHGTKPPLPSLRWKRQAGPPRSSSRHHRRRPEETCCPRLCQQPPSPVPAGGPSLGRQSSDGPGTRELLTSPPPASTQSAPSALTGRRFHEHGFPASPVSGVGCGKPSYHAPCLPFLFPSWLKEATWCHRKNSGREPKGLVPISAPKLPPYCVCLGGNLLPSELRKPHI